MSANQHRQDSAGRFASAWIVAFGVACTPAPMFRPAWDPAVRPRPAPTETGEATDASDVGRYAAQMHRWLGGVSRLRDAVILGQEAVVASEAAVVVAELRLDEAPPSWKPAVGRLRSGAARVAGGVSLTDAGVLVAQMADACGMCHQSNGIAATVEKALPEPALPRAQSQSNLMRHHAWGAERMWEGLVSPSERRWVRGTTSFVVAPGCPPLPDAPADARCQEARTIARRSHTVTDRRGRVALYGEMLSTCAGCHSDR